VPVADATSAQRFKTLMSVFTPMASVLADLPRSRFEACMRWVGSLERKVRDGTWLDSSEQPSSNTQPRPDRVVEPCLSLEVGTDNENNDDDDDDDDDCRDVEPDDDEIVQLLLSLHEDSADDVHDDASITPSNSLPTRASTSVAVSLPNGNAPAADVQYYDCTQPSGNSNACTSTSAGFVLPRKVKQRGRPAQTRQRTFRVKENNGKQNAQAATGEQRTKRKCGLSATTGNQRGTKRKYGPSATTCDDNCPECGCVDPPTSKNKTVNWTQCDHCEFWYHNACINRKGARADPYVCNRCKC